MRATLEARGIKLEDLPPAEDLKMIEKRIKQDDSRKFLPAEKPLKIEGTFNETLSHLAQIPPPENK